jgi:hypothetical protein
MDDIYKQYFCAEKLVNDLKYTNKIRASRGLLPARSIG